MKGKIPSLIFLQKHIKIGLAYFLMIAFLGVLLRFFSIIDLPINYRFTVHSHSHVALLGWIYTALTTLIFKMYLSKTNVYIKYKRLFWATQLTIIGMLISFPFTGYALFSIVFSTLFLIASYFFAYFIFKYTPISYKQTNSYKCIRVALWYMIISSIGPWALGIIIKTVGNDSDLYRNAIYFYLHFQYNGWFILALLGIFLYILEQQKITLTKKTFQSFFWLLNSGVLLTFGISLLWMKPTITIYIISGLGALFQLVAFYFLLEELRSFKQQLITFFSKFYFQLLKITGLLFFLKLVFQIIGSTPYFAKVISSNVDLIIGYLHWTFLGVVSIAILLFLYQFKLIQLSKKSVYIYLIGFILTEAFIFYKGIVVWGNFSLANNYFEYLVIVSCVLLIGIFNLFINQFKRK
ncbi:hypothetical protein CXF68_13170 [Tenacibaculum sp. Bg11-29]|uniref:hypothetical protein n=1 Tax=Tenacibaculum sp. Bg11-29 TaxID=2058306 RepID=UPI000C34ACF6|nr:hypothetical protein [Tenacibaculum sp. Bg11-29]PKH51576.1 hypothetical protein CXF68_13170 [Tenacibaculum sp. Bg11-29]